MTAPRAAAAAAGLPRPARRGRPGHDLESLLQTAVRLFNERGYDGTSMEDLSRKLGITKSAIYHHVPSKEELLRLATGRALDGLFEVAAEVAATPGPAIDRLERLVRGSVAVLADRLPFVTLLLRVHGNTKAERDALARRREFDRFAAELVKQAAAEGDLRPDIDPAVTAKLLFGLVNSLIEWYRPRRGTSAAELADAVCTIAFEGLRLRAPCQDAGIAGSA
jgi:AcrR family transcriptional regulator